jgi:2-deoxy-D-gluconate 3-dehydrogenase
MLDTRKEGDDRGKIINIASLVSFQGGMTVPAYAAAKHGILGLTKGMSNDFAGRGINVNASASPFPRPV